MSGPSEGSGKEQLRSLLSEAGFLDIPPDEVFRRVKEAKEVVSRRLIQLLGRTSKIEERESAAHSLGTLKKLETMVAGRVAIQDMSRK